METEQTEVNLRIVRAFDILSVPYFLGGSMASSIHGIYRATADADFIADLKPEHSEPLARLLHPAFYADVRAIRDAIFRGQSFNLIHLDTMFKFDVFVASDDPFRRDQMQRRLLQPISTSEKISIYIASPDDTVLSKLKWYRDGGSVSDRQWGDALSVLKVQGVSLDQAYLRAWAKKLEFTDLLSRAFKEAGLARDA